ncbi:unnamed protein product, partial [marine sediment metagenome]
DKLSLHAAKEYIYYAYYIFDGAEIPIRFKVFLRTI